jgi:hypothetical protein
MREGALAGWSLQKGHNSQKLSALSFSCVRRASYIEATRAFDSGEMQNAIRE